MATTFQIRINFDILASSWFDVTSLATGKQLCFDSPFPETVRELILGWIRDYEDGTVLDVSKETMIQLRDSLHPPVPTPVNPVVPVVAPVVAPVVNPVPSPVPTPVNPVVPVVAPVPHSNSYNVAPIGSSANIVLTNDEDANLKQFANFTGRFFGFGYDIRSDSGIKNPADYLHTFAFRPRKSEWLVQVKDLPKILEIYHEINEDSKLYPDQSRVDIDLFYQTCEQRHVQNGIANFEREICKIHTSMILSLDNASRKYAEKLAEFQEEYPNDRYTQNKKADAWRKARANAILKSAEDKIRDAVTLAETYEDLMNVDDLIAAQRNAIKASRILLNQFISYREQETLARLTREYMEKNGIERKKTDKIDE